MNKTAIVIETPDACMHCPMYREADKIPLGNFTYQQLYRCRLEPEDVEEIYLPDIVHKKPDWCPLKPLPESIPPERADYAHEASYIQGWNECLEKILENK